MQKDKTTWDTRDIIYTECEANDVSFGDSEKSSWYPVIEKKKVLYYQAILVKNNDCNCKTLTTQLFRDEKEAIEWVYTFHRGCYVFLKLQTNNPVETEE